MFHIKPQFLMTLQLGFKRTRVLFQTNRFKFKLNSEEQRAENRATASK